MKILILIISEIFLYYINNKKQFHDTHKNKSSKNENKIKFKDDVNVKFIVIFYYVINIYKKISVKKLKIP